VLREVAGDESSGEDPMAGIKFANATPVVRAQIRLRDATTSKLK